MIFLRGERNALLIGTEQHVAEHTEQRDSHNHDDDISGIMWSFVLM